MIDEMTAKGYQFSRGERGLSLYHRASGASLHCDFVRGARAERIKRMTAAADLAKAVGVRRSGVSCLDATCGLATDGMSLQRLGCRVTMIEHSFAIHALVDDALLRFERSLERHRVAQALPRLYLGDALELIPQLPPHEVIYLDPMYSLTHKSAQPNKAMQFFRDLAEAASPEKDGQLFELALRHATRRVVVKRSVNAPPISPMKVNFSVKAKTTRFDVYVPSSRAS